MNEVVITSNKMNHLVDPVLHAWGWEVPLYLYLGGLSAGILIISSLVVLSRKEETFPAAAYKMFLWPPIFLAVGMLALWLDLEHRWYAWRFYATFQVTSPMSWGSWILLVVAPVSLVLACGTLKIGYPSVYRFFTGRMPKWIGGIVEWAVEFSEKHIYTAAKFAVPLGVMLGIYTGILLSAFGARPFWNSAILGPIFLVSGLSTALALTIIFSRNSGEKTFFAKLLAAVICTELVFIGLMLINMASSSRIKQEALHIVLGGELTKSFWVGDIGFGLLLPLILLALQLKWRMRMAFVAPVLVLIGGYMFRQIMVEAGQISSWIPY